MECPWSGKIVDIYYDSHPHWVIDYACYAVTIRCKGSLPLPIQLKLKEIGQSLNSVAPADNEAEQLRRKHFALLDHALDSAIGEWPFSEESAASTMHHFISEYHADGLSFSHWVVMPNHVHLITAPVQHTSAKEFQSSWRRFKSLSAKHFNLMMGRRGPVWQSSWYDRWIRNESECLSWQNYLRKNPVKAGLKNWNFLK